MSLISNASVKIHNNSNGWGCWLWREKSLRDSRRGAIHGPPVMWCDWASPARPTGSTKKNKHARTGEPHSSTGSTARPRAPSLSFSRSRASSVTTCLRSARSLSHAVFTIQCCCYYLIKYTTEWLVLVTECETLYLQCRWINCVLLIVVREKQTATAGAERR